MGIPYRTLQPCVPPATFYSAPWGHHSHQQLLTGGQETSRQPQQAGLRCSLPCQTFYNQEVLK